MSKQSISLFISDIHLSESRNDIVTAFFYFVENIAPTADKLYILGDLFDFWAGDDIETALTESVAEKLSILANQGTEIFFIPGNRDFALGAHYAKKASMTLVGESLKIENDHLLLIHGDELCIEDVEYQRYKKWIRNPFVLWILKRLPKQYRLNLAHKIRTKSKNAPKKAIIDVTSHYVDQFFEAQNVRTIIHGHTHRAAEHLHLEKYQRYVLSDWDEKGDYLKLENGKLSRHIFRVNPFTLVASAED